MISYSRSSVIDRELVLLIGDSHALGEPHLGRMGSRVAEAETSNVVRAVAGKPAGWAGSNPHYA